MKIGIDIDDVLADFLEELIQFHNENYDTKLTRKDFISYELTLIFNIPIEELYPRIKKFYHSKNFDQIKPILDSVSAIKKLSQKHELFVITSRFDIAIEKTIPWLKRHYGDAFKDVHFTPYDTKLKKVEVCKRLGITLMIEDSSQNVIECSREGINVLVLDMPWNRNFEFLSNVKRVHSWKEILACIEKME